MFLQSLPLLERLAGEFEGQYNVLKMTIDKHPMISNHDRIQGVAAFWKVVRWRGIVLRIVFTHPSLPILLI